MESPFLIYNSQFLINYVALWLGEGPCRDGSPGNRCRRASSNCAAAFAAACLAISACIFSRRAVISAIVRSWRALTYTIRALPLFRYELKIKNYELKIEV